jgi:DNA excision repair protein ERCC-4
MSSFRRHIPYLPFHKQVIREICRPQKDDLLIMAKGLGMRRVRRGELSDLDAGASYLLGREAGLGLGAGLS